MEIIMAVSNFYSKKYFFNNKLFDLPASITDEIKSILLQSSELTRGIVSLGFYDDGELFLTCTSDPRDLSYDIIGANLELKRIYNYEREFINNLETWYSIYFKNK